MTRPTTGVFIAWDEEAVDVERYDAGTVRDRTVVVGRRTVVSQALWSNEITQASVAAVDRYAESIKDQYDNVRVQIFTRDAKRA